MAKSGILMSKQDGVFPEGRYQAWATESGTRASVMKPGPEGIIIVHKNYKGESAWSNAIRDAGDLNAKERK